MTALIRYVWSRSQDIYTMTTGARHEAYYYYFCPGLSSVPRLKFTPKLCRMNLLALDNPNGKLVGKGLLERSHVSSEAETDT
jgi:hypothetical protein